MVKNSKDIWKQDRTLDKKSLSSTHIKVSEGEQELKNPKLLTN